MQWFEEHGDYRVSWVASGVYIAWHREPWCGFGWAPIACIRPADVAGTNEQRRVAAQAACREHWQMKKGGNSGTG